MRHPLVKSWFLVGHFMAKPAKIRPRACSLNFLSTNLNLSILIIQLRICESLSPQKTASGNRNSGNRQKHRLRKQQFRKLLHFREVRKSRSLQICDLRNLFADSPPLTDSVDNFWNEIPYILQDYSYKDGNLNLLFHFLKYIFKIWVFLFGLCNPNLNQTDEFSVYIFPTMKSKSFSVETFHSL